MNIDSESLEQAAQRLRNAQRLVVFTGAGVSAESGIPTFRDADGFWQRFPPEQFACWTGLGRTAFLRPGKLAEFLHAVLEPIAVAKPNDAHRAVAALEQHTQTTVITQNVDGLHQEAGSSRVYEVHGSFFKVVSPRNHMIRRLCREDLVRITDAVGRTRTGIFKLARLLWALRPMFGLGWRGSWRPGTVLFGDGMAEPDWTWALRATKLCDVMLVVGTSGIIYPAALLPNTARQQGSFVIGIDPLEGGPSHVWLPGRAAEVLPYLLEAAFR